MHCADKKNSSICLGVTYTLVMLFYFSLNALAALPPQPKQPLEPSDRLKTLDTPKIAQLVPSPGIESPFLWQTSRGDIRKDFGKGEGNIHWGALELHPIAAVKETYDTNIFLQPRGQESMDWITNYLVGLAAKMPLVASRGDDFLAEGEYHANFLDFMRYDSSNRVDHTAHGSIKGDFSNGFGAKITEDFFLTEDPANNERTGPSKRFYNKTDARVNYTREKITLETAYTLIMSHYLELLHNLSYNDHMMTAGVFYNISEKTRLLTEFNLGRIEYLKSFSNSNSYYYQGRVGAEGQIAPKTTGTIKFGFRYQDYARKTSQDSARPSIFGNLKYELSERTSLNLYGESRPEESSYATNSFYTSNIVGFKAEHLLTERLAVDGSIFWAYDRYPELSTEGTDSGKRADVLMGSAVGVKYELKKWWLFDVSYGFKQRDSRFNNFDYKDQQVSARTTFLL